MVTPIVGAQNYIYLMIGRLMDKEFSLCDF